VRGQQLCGLWPKISAQKNKSSRTVLMEIPTCNVPLLRMFTLHIFLYMLQKISGDVLIYNLSLWDEFLVHNSINIEKQFLI
jgi:hypothetical protein